MSGAVLVTGGAKRIGRAIVLAMADAGYDVAIHCRTSKDAAEALAGEVRAMGRRAAVVTADLSREDQVRRLVPEAVAGLGGPLTGLVNNASAFEDDRVGDLSRALWDRHMETNLRAPVVLAEALAAQVPGGGGWVVNLLDQRVKKPDPRFFSSALPRAGLWWATRTLAQALAPAVRVNGVGPGPTLASVHQSEAEFQAEVDGTPLQRANRPEEIADAVLWLAQAPGVTGQMIAVDAGQHLAWRTPDIEED